MPTTTKPKISVSFKDGTSINEIDIVPAKAELKAFLIGIVGVPYRSVNRDKPYPGIAQKFLYEENPATDARFLRATAGEQVQQTGVRLVRSKLSPKEMKMLKSGLPQKEVAVAQALRLIQEDLKCIAGRKTGWTLLGVKSRKELSDLVANCWGADAAPDVMARHLFPKGLLLQLLARKIKLE